jgi:EmrB/QacA subfamily drug resistance transporter
VLVATILASSMVFIDGTVVNVALPALQRELHASLADVQWVVESYALLLAALLLVGGAAGDRLGRRRVFSVGVALFAAASIACALAGTVRMLILARAVQGIGGALLVPGSLAIISASFEEHARGKAIGTWSAATAVTMALGPVLGGWLIDHASWRAAFFINVPLAVAVLLITRRHVPESRDAQQQGPLDWKGAALVTLGLGAIVYALIESTAGRRPGSLLAFAAVLGAVALAAFVVVERRHPAPMVPPQLFRSRVFTGANLLTLLLYAALGGSLFFLPLDLIQVHGYSTTAAGAALLPLVVLLGALSRWSGGLIDRHGATVPLVAGPVIAACGFALLALPGTGGTYWTTFFPALVVLGLGLALTVAPLTTTVMNAVATRHAGAASGINNAASRTAGVLAVAALGVVMVPVFDRSLDQRLRSTGVAPAAIRAIEAQRSKLAAIEPPATLDAQGRAAAERAIKEAFVAGFRAIVIVASALALASAASAWILIGRSPHPE